MENFKLCYKYSSDNILIGTSKSYLDKQGSEDSYLLPINSTFQVPPTYGNNQIPIFNKDSNSWSLISNYRFNTIYNKITKESKLVDYYGEIEVGYTLLFPKFYSIWSEELNTWIIDHDKLYQSIYSQVTSTTSSLIEKGYYQYKDSSNNLLISVSTDTINQGRFNAKAFICSLGQLTFPFEIWDGNVNYVFTTSNEFMTFCISYGSYIESIAREGKILRDSLKDMTDEELLNFKDPRLT